VQLFLWWHGVVNGNVNPNMLIRSLAFLSSAFFLNVVIAATQQPAPSAVTQAVLAGKLIDVRSGEVRTHAYILIAGDRIQSIAAAAPSGIPVTDLSAYTVLPGLIDAHAHVLSDPTTQNFAAHLRTSIPQATVWGVYNLPLWLDHGFTSVRDACEGPATRSMEYGARKRELQQRCGNKSAR